MRADEPAEALNSESRLDADVSRSFGFEGDIDAFMARVAQAVREPTPDELGFIAGFRLLSVVARGGQGTVYKAIEPGTGRSVAIKRLHPDASSSSALARFDREAEIVASLRHPGIVTLLARHDVGEQRVLVMEWIDGRPIDRWADEQREQYPPDEATRRIVDAVAALADAVAYAHRNGVIHRDLKPSNLIVDAQAAPHVLDFGLALPFGRDDTAITKASGFLGTPSYAAPEQVANRHVDARADVHAVGAILYRTLTGVHPFDERASLPELFRQIVDVDPAPPSRHMPSVGRELSLVCLKALAKEPDRRYTTMEELSADLRRWLRNEPVIAHPTELGYVLRKSIARHRVAFVIATVSLATLIGATAVSTWLALSLASERENLLNSRTEEQIAKVAAQAGADEAMRQAREALRATESALRARDFLQRVFAGLHAASMDGSAVSAGTILELARNELLLQSHPPDVEAELRETLASAFEEIGDRENALTEFRRAESLLLQQAQGDGDLLALVRLGIGRQISSLGSRVDAIPALTQALAWFRDARDYPHASDTSRLLATAVNQIEGPQAALRVADEAIEFAQYALDGFRVGASMSTQAIILLDLGRVEDSLRVSSEALQCLREHVDPRHPELGRALHNDAYLNFEAGRYEESIASARASIAIRQNAFGERTLISLTTVGLLMRSLRGSGEIEQAIDLGRQTIARFAESDEGQLATTNFAYHYLRVLDARGTPADREEILERSRTLIDQTVGDFGARAARAVDLLRLRMRALVRSGVTPELDSWLNEESARWILLGADPRLCAIYPTFGILAGLIDSKAVDPIMAAARLELIIARSAALDAKDEVLRIDATRYLGDAREMSGALEAARDAYATALHAAVQREGETSARAKVLRQRLSQTEAAIHARSAPKRDHTPTESP